MIIQHWKPIMKELGFTMKRGPLFWRARGCLFQYIFERKTSGGIDICPAIGIDDPFRETPMDIVALRASLKPDQTSLTDFEDVFPWDVSNHEQALQAFQDHGIRWLDEYADVRRLIQFFETEWLVKTQQMQRKESPAWYRPLSRHIHEKRLVTHNPPIHSYYLSLLYFACGDKDKAIEYTKAQLKFVTESIKLDDEPERTIRQLRTIESSLP